MRKSWVGLAVIGSFAGATEARSSVPIYGIIDMAVSKANSGQSNLAYFGDWRIGRTGQWELHSASSSRLGVRGSEDLGDGLKAIFLMEHRFQPDAATWACEYNVAGFAGFTRGGNFVAAAKNPVSYISPNPHAAYPVTQGQRSTKFGLGYVHHLSKRSSLSADIGTNKTRTYSRSTGVQSALKHVF